MKKSKIEIATIVSGVAEKTKLGSMAVTAGAFMLKSKRVPIIGTAICFASIIAETIADIVIISSELSSNDEDVFNECNFCEDCTEDCTCDCDRPEYDQASKLRDIAEEIQDEEDNFEVDEENLLTKIDPEKE